MFAAYSEILHDTIHVNDAYDLDEEFRCPNLCCSARFTIRSATGKRVKHFARLPSTTHIDGCEYETGDSRFTQSDLQIRSPLEDIFGDYINPGNHTGTTTNKDSANDSPTILRINTPKKLLKFCLLNSLRTEYQSGITVDGIILDRRNLVDKGRFEGVEGFRIIIGETVDLYKNDKLYLMVKAESKYGKKVSLHVDVKMDGALLHYIKKHINETYGSFAGHPVAVLGKWTIDKKYYISCEVRDRKHVILKF